MKLFNKIFFNKHTNLYNLIGLTKSASKNDIRSASLRMMRRFHPDVHNHKFAESKFREINNAYKILTTELTKNNYDNLTDKELDAHFKLWMDKYEHYDTFSRRIKKKCLTFIPKKLSHNKLLRFKKIFIVPKNILYALNIYIPLKICYIFVDYLPSKTKYILDNYIGPGFVGIGLICIIIILLLYELLMSLNPAIFVFIITLMLIHLFLKKSDE
jgi:hypothetical protein